MLQKINISASLRLSGKSVLHVSYGILRAKIEGT